jgi:DNA polymerase
MSDRDELLRLTRQVREHLAWLERGNVVGVPRGQGRVAPPEPVPAAPPASRPPVRAQAQAHAPTAHPNAPSMHPNAPSAHPNAPSSAGSFAAAQAPSSASPPAPTVAPAPRAAGDARLTLPLIREDLGECTRCKLHQLGRQKIVFGVGSPTASLVFVGEAPGADEDRIGEPFVGAAGQLLTKMIGAMGLSRDEVYICNILKCRPPGNRNPEPDEIEQCEPFLKRQLAAIGPRLIVCLGKFATQTLLRSDAPISRLRGRFHTYEGIPLMPTYHPAFLLRNPSAKRDVWQDLQVVMAEMDKLGLPRKR